MQDSEALRDDVPVADAVEQQRAVGGPGLDEDESAGPAPEPPMEATAEDWQEQLETVDLDDEEDVRDV